MSNRTLAGAAATVTLALAFFVSPLASSSPDGLQKVAAEQGIDAGVTDNALSGAPLAGYSAGGSNTGLSRGVAGVVGTGLTLVLGYGLFAFARRSRHRADLDEQLTSAA